MADLNFPQNPQVGDTYTIGSRTWVWNGTAWQLQSAIQSLDPFTVKTLIVTSSTNSTSTNSGALIIEGGVGIGGDLWIGGTFYASGQAVLTTASFFSAISEGTDIRITEGSSGTVIISNTSTLQSVTSRGSTTTNTIRISNNTLSTTTDTGALVVTGGIGVGGTITASSINAVDSLTASGLSTLSTTTVTGIFTVNGIAQILKTVVNPSATVVNTSPVVLDSFATTQYRSAKYFISISNTATNQHQTSEIWLVQDGDTASIEQTSVFSSGTNYVVMFSTDITGGVVSLIGTGIDINNRVKVQSTYITV